MKSQGLSIDLSTVSLETDPEYKATREKLEVNKKLLADAHKAYTRALASVDDGARSQSQTDVDAQAILAGERPQAVFVPQQNLAEKAYRDIRTYSRVVEILEARLRAVGARVSREISEKVFPAYKELIQQIAVASLEVARLSDAEVQFREQLMAKGISPTFRVMPMQRLGSAADENSFLRMYISEATQYGLVEPDLIQKYR